MSARSIRRAEERRAEREQRRTTPARSKAAVGAGAALGATVLFAPAAEAATFTVTNLDDSGPGSLRQAILDANANGEDDVVTFQAGLSGTINLTGGEIPITGEGLDLQGPGASNLTVDAGANSRIFYVHSFTDPGEDVRIAGLTLTGGDTSSQANTLGGALYSDGGSDYAADLTVADAVLTGNRSPERAGAIWQDEGTLTVVNTVLSNNAAGEGGGAIYQDNSSDVGGYDVVIRDTTLSGNTAEGDGGGLAVNGSEDVLIEASTISGNTATGSGGGIDLGPTDGDVLIQNSTVSGNRANYYGGGITSFNPSDDERTIRNSTIVDNTAGIGPSSPGDDPGGGVYADFADDGGGADEDNLNLSSTIVANNVPTDLADNDLDPPEGDFVAGFSLIEAPGTARSRLTESPAGSNLLGVDPQLGPLADNGGPTQTHVPALTSPVIDAGIANGLATDQRGLARTGDLSANPNAPGSDGTDIGSVEIQAGDCQGESVPRQDGTDGDDTLVGGDGPDALFGKDGNDRVSGRGDDDCVAGDQGRDRLSGGPGKDLVKGGAAKDRAAGNGGKDKVKGQGGKDRLKGGGSKDKLVGGDARDSLKGGGGKDKLKGGAGKDRLIGGGGKDRINCGGGKDKVIASDKDKVSSNCEKVVERR